MQATIDGHASVLFERNARHQQDPLVAPSRRCDVFLHDEVAAGAHRGNDLGQVGGFATAEEKDIAPTVAEEWLDDRRTVELTQERAHAVGRTGDERARPNGNRKSRQVHLRASAPKAIGIVEHERARFLELAPELDGGVDPNGVSIPYERIVAQQYDLECRERDLPAHGAFGAQRRHQRRRRGFVVGARPNDGTGDLALVREIVDRYEGNLVPAPLRGGSQIRRCVGRAKSSGIVDDEENAHLLAGASGTPTDTRLSRATQRRNSGRNNRPARQRP